MLQNLFWVFHTVSNGLYVQTGSSIESGDVITLPSGLTLFFKVLVHCVQQSGPFGKFILLILLLFSIGSWAIMVERWKYFHSLRMTSNRFMADVWSSKKLLKEAGKLSSYDQSPFAHLYRAACLQVEGDPQSPETFKTKINLQLVERALDRTISEQTAGMEKYLSFLATTASATPFIGLLGTVWGILSTFYEMGVSGSANFTTIAPGLAEALIATAAGLAAAIPAVIAYNHFTTKIRRINNQMYHFTSEIMSHIEKNYI